MSNISQRVPSMADLFKEISNDKSLTLFNSNAVSNGAKHLPLKEMDLTTKQYYSRVSGLLNAGLIKRHKGNYSLTLLGKVVKFISINHTKKQSLSRSRMLLLWRNNTGTRVCTSGSVVILVVCQLY